ncbi:MAG TPA: abortive infection system antitoxin AbiGi family protein [Saprospiraceae bacterium]|nr:abortive infection system antitoxin AbiGi family protein [Saprospiraceae bacterium]
MSKLSSDSTLFHFTGKLKYLKNILRQGFAPRYYLEDFSLFEGPSVDKEMAVPMVCFCDIPLSSVQPHMKTYGSYGIGVKKRWGMLSRATPLVYVTEESETVKSIAQALLILNSNPVLLSDPNVANQFQALLKFIRFTKKYKGPFFRRDKWLSEVLFYGEKEWRIVPDILSAIANGTVRKAVPWMPKDYFEKYRYSSDPLVGIPDSVEDMNEELRRAFPLKPKLEDIRYIIVKHERDALQLIKFARKEGIYTGDQMDIFISRILTQEQMTQDF